MDEPAATSEPAVTAGPAATNGPTATAGPASSGTGRAVASPFRRRFSSLATRIVVTTVSVALLAALATAVVAFQLVRQVTVNQSREALRSSMSIVSDAPAAERAVLVRDIDRVHVRGVRLLLIEPDGTLVPKAGAGVPASAIATVKSTGAISTQVEQSGRTLLVQGTTLSGGGALIATQDFALVQSATKRLFLRILLALALGVVIAVAVGVLVARLVSRPLRRAAADARLLASGRRGILSPRPSGVTEVDDMTEALTTLDEALATSEGRQHEFLLSISHEIRTPLTALRGYADALADGLVPASAVAEVGRTLAAETGRLDAFTRDLLELARLEADDFVLRPEPIDLVVVARDAVTAWEGRAALLQVTLTLDAVTGRAPFVSDPMRVRQLLDGLLENALRASPAGSAIVVSVASHASGPWRPPGSPPVAPWVAATVRDHGPGLTEADTAEAFERGMLADRYREQRSVGTGLGLSIAARLVRRLGGTIVVERPEGGGAAFTVKWPASV